MLPHCLMHLSDLFFILHSSGELLNYSKSQNYMTFIIISSWRQQKNIANKRDDIRCIYYEPSLTQSWFCWQYGVNRARWFLLANVVLNIIDLYLLLWDYGHIRNHSYGDCKQFSSLVYTFALYYLRYSLDLFLFFTVYIIYICILWIFHYYRQIIISDIIFLIAYNIFNVNM